MSGLVVPRQERSSKSLEAMAAAAERLLEDRPFEDISLTEICRAASLTTGAFYARFASKDALMPLLYERYEQWLLEAMPKHFNAVAWRRLSARSAAERVVRILVALFRERPWLLRAITLFARGRPQDLPAASVRASSVLVEEIARALSAHVRPKSEAALRFATFAVVSTAREAVLFGGAPVASATLSPAAVDQELARLLIGYLQAADALVERKRGD